MTTRYRSWKKTRCGLRAFDKFEYWLYRNTPITVTTGFFGLARSFSCVQRPRKRNEPTGCIRPEREERNGEKYTLHLSAGYKSSFPLNYVISESTLPIKGRRASHLESWRGEREDKWRRLTGCLERIESSNAESNTAHVPLNIKIFSKAIYPRGFE